MAVLILQGNPLATAASTNSFVNFETAPIHPVALSPDGRRLAVCNLASSRLELFNLDAGTPRAAASIPVGLDPVSTRFRHANELWVVNQISDSISVIHLDTLQVVATINTADAPALDRSFPLRSRPGAGGKQPVGGQAGSSQFQPVLPE